MRRADRLFQIVQILRGGRLVTARQLSERLEVSERTIYRDVADLVGSGVPVDGEAGVGYLLRDGYDLPPLMFSNAEITALEAGARFVKAWAGGRMAEAAHSALEKIETILPAARKGQAAQTPIFAPNWRMRPLERERFDLIHEALNDCHVIEIDYCDAEGQRTRRALHPLGLFYWGDCWTLVAWCTLREDFRSFRLDRLEEMEVRSDKFEKIEGQRLSDYFAKMMCEDGISPAAFVGRS